MAHTVRVGLEQARGQPSRCRSLRQCAACQRQHAAGMSTRSGDHSEYIGFLRRVVRAAGRRVAHADPEDLVELIEVRAELDQAITAAVAVLRSQGFSWSEIAAPLGVSRQAAQQRFGVNDALTLNSGPGERRTA